MKNDLKLRNLVSQISWRRVAVGVLFLSVVLAVGCGIYFFVSRAPMAADFVFGVNFSQIFSEQMGLDWRENYLAILDDLCPKKIRLVAYWPLIEPERGKYVFADLDWQVDEAAKRDMEVILVVGQRVPRWPECHIPAWAADLPKERRQEEIRELLVSVVERYRANRAIKVWQVENEPFLEMFGECPALDRDFLREEISVVREADRGQRPIMLTASGELSSWTKPARLGDIFGTTLYRTIWNKYLGYFDYPLPPVFYYKRAQLVRWLTGVGSMMISELQAEPWGPKPIYAMDKEQQFESMNWAKIEAIAQYAKETGFSEAYFWGAEWWYWLKTQGDDTIWQGAKRFFET